MKFEVDVTSTVIVELDESKFTEEFMEEFRKDFYDFFTIEDHAAHIVQLASRELPTNGFIEGYGESSDMGIKTSVEDVYEEVYKK